MIKATITGVDVVISGLDQFGVDVREAAYYGVIDAIKKAFEACRDVISEGDHTLKDLAMMQHPYGHAHPMQIHDPDVLVHVQSGAYRDALRAVPPVGAGGTVIGGQVVNDSPYDRFIQEGTLNMRARPWMEWIVKEYGQDFADLVIAHITQAAKAMGAR